MRKHSCSFFFRSTLIRSSASSRIFMARFLISACPISALLRDGSLFVRIRGGGGGLYSGDNFGWKENFLSFAARMTVACSLPTEAKFDGTIKRCVFLGVQCMREVLHAALEAGSTKPRVVLGALSVRELAGAFSVRDVCGRFLGFDEPSRDLLPSRELFIRSSTTSLFCRAGRSWSTINATNSACVRTCTELCGLCVLAGARYIVKLCEKNLRYLVL